MEEKIREGLPGCLSEESVAEAKAILSQIINIPSAPPVAFKLLSKLKNASQNNDEVVEIIKYDANLTASVLKVCNSGIFQAKTEVRSIEDAIIRIGYHKLNDMVVTISLGKVYTKPKKGNYISPEYLWQETLRGSFAAKILATECPVLAIDPDLAFTVGLLSNMGRFALMNLPSAIPLKIPDVIRQNNLREYEAEYQVLGTTTAVIGSILLQSWKLPTAIVEATYFRDLPQYCPGATQLAYICNMAGVFALVVGNEAPSEYFKSVVPQEIRRVMGLEDGMIERVLEQVEAKASEIQSYMGAVS
ncbi:MAG: HDOD domain-containing protein [Verrucomicrobiota bacterium]